MAPESLVKLAVQASTDADAVPVLHDLMLELGWPRHRLVMPLCLGMDLEPERLDHQTEPQKEAWEKMVQKSHDAANNAWEQYAGRHQAWARAVLAALLFGEWSTPMRGTPYPFRTCSPWRVVRSLALRQSKPYRDETATRRAAYKARDAARARERELMNARMTPTWVAPPSRTEDGR